MTTTIAKVKKKPTKKVIGRTSLLLNAEIYQTLLDYIRMGTPITHAVGAAGISSKAFYNWMARGMSERERLAAVPNAKENPTEVIFVHFVHSVERTKAEAVAKKIATVTKASIDGDWRAAAWWLERQVPNEFGKIDRVEIGGNNAEPIRVQIEMGDLEAKIARVIAQRKK
jgi:hypothetical protein